MKDLDKSANVFCGWSLTAVLDQRPKFYGGSRRFKTYGYGYGGRSLRQFLRPKVLLVVFSKMEAEMCFYYTGPTSD